MDDIMKGLVAGKEIDLEKLLEILGKGITEEISIVNYMDKMKVKDKYTYNHSINVALYSFLIGKWLGFKKEEIKNVTKAGLLHDIGKIKIPFEILNKKGKLSDDEFEIIKLHTVIGYNLSKDIPNLEQEVRQAILYHHEREDGKGYPYGLKRNEINIYAKILAIADVYDALTSERIYKKKSTPFEAIKEFYNMGVESFNEYILNEFFTNIVKFYLNSKVRMNNGENGKIVFISPNNIIEPIVKIKNSYIDLSKDKNFKIVEMIG